MKLSLPLKVTLGIVGAGFAAWLLFGFFGIQALFMDRTVNEDVPLVSVPADVPPPSSTSPSQTAATSSPTTNPTTKPPLAVSITPKLVAQGTFQQGDRTYTIRGKAVVSEKDGVRTLALTDFDVTNGPDLFVYVVSAPDVKNDTVKNAVGEKQFVNLGALKGNRGNQTYVIPPDLKLDDQSIISIWCRRFSRNFGSADLLLIP